MGFDIYSFYEYLTTTGVKIRLDAGDPDHGPPAEVLEVLAREVRGGLGYTPSSGLRELRERIAEMHGVEVREVVITPGAKAAIAALIHRASKVGVFAPHWSGYEAAASFFGKALVAHRLSPESGWVPRNEDAESLAGKADLVILNYPNNPTGAVIDEARARGVIEVLRDAGATIVSDEAYRDIVFKGRGLVMAELVSGGVASVYSFSKTFALPGLRVGYVVGDADLVEHVRRFIASTYTGVPRFAQAAALKALDLLEEYSGRVRRLYMGRLGTVISHLNKGLFEFTPPRGGLYLFLRIRCGLGGASLAYRLARRGVGVFPGEAFGGEWFRQYIRVSLTAPAETLVEGIGIITEEVEAGCRQ